MGQRRDRGAVLEHVFQPLGRVGRIKGHIGAARLVDRDKSNHHFEAALGANRYTIVRLHAQGSQMMGEAVGPGVQLGVGQPLAVAYDRDRLRRQRYLRLDELVHALILRRIRFGRIPLVQHSTAVVLVEQRLAIGYLRRQAPRLHWGRYGAVAPERFARLMVGIPQYRPQKCCRIRDRLPLRRRGANTGSASPHPDLSSLYQDGKSQPSRKTLKAPEQWARGCDGIDSQMLRKHAVNWICRIVDGFLTQEEEPSRYQIAVKPRAVAENFAMGPLLFMPNARIGAVSISGALARLFFR
jgi:hypothetical protein